MIVVYIYIDTEAKTKNIAFIITDTMNFSKTKVRAY